MATYSAITSGQIDAESPLDVTLAGQWTNNLLAVIEGAAGAPRIVDAALVWPGAWAEIDSWIPTAVSSKDFTWDETLYSEIYIHAENLVPSADATEFYIQMGHTNGTVFITNNHVLWYLSDGNPPAPGQTSSSSGYNITPLVSVGTAAGEGINFDITLKGLIAYDGAGGGYPYCNFTSVYEDATGAFQSASGYGSINTLKSVNNLDTARLSMTNALEAGSGFVTVYGLKR